LAAYLAGVGTRLAETNPEESSMKTLIAAAAFAALIVSPSFAQSPAGTHHHVQSSHHHRAAVRGPASAVGAVTPFDAAGNSRMTASPASAIHQCNDFASKGYPEKDSNMRLSQYRACMAQLGQPE